MRKQNLLRALAFAAALVLSLSAALTALADYETIPYGEQSNRVRQMQKTLKSRGYYKGDIDGKFGPSTKTAVRRYQSAIGLYADGKPGDKTLTALYEGVSAVNETNNTERKELTKPTNPRTLYYGCTGSRVKSLQRALKKAGVYKGSIDGVYGDLTYEAVKKYQSKRGLKVDGMAGTQTLASLNRNTGVKISSGFVLSVGSKGEEVKSVARRLAALGYNPSSGDEYTEETASAVRKWQRANGHTVTGTITEAEYNRLVLE